MEVTEENLLKTLGAIAFSKPAAPPTVTDQHAALVALMRHKGMFPNAKTNGNAEVAAVGHNSLCGDTVHHGRRARRGRRGCSARQGGICDGRRFG